jgi:mRNA interferase MazF
MDFGVATARLLKPSAVKPIFATLEQGLVIRSLGRLVERDRGTLASAIGEMLG